MGISHGISLNHYGCVCGQVCWSSCLPYIWSASLCCLILWKYFDGFLHGIFSVGWCQTTPKNLWRNRISHISFPSFRAVFELGWLSLLFFRSQRWGATVLNCCSAIAYFGATMCKAAVLLWPALLSLLRWTRRNRGNRKNCNEGCPATLWPKGCRWFLCCLKKPNISVLVVPCRWERQQRKEPFVFSTGFALYGVSPLAGGSLCCKMRVGSRHWYESWVPELSSSASDAGQHFQGLGVCLSLHLAHVHSSQRAPGWKKKNLSRFFEYFSLPIPIFTWKRMEDVIRHDRHD